MAQAANPATPDTSNDTPMSLIDWLTASCRHIALLAAMIATGGSLFFSEVLGWIPCELCWYQRILMYPLTVIISVGILRNDRKMYLYALPLAITGMGVALYHYLVVMMIIPPPACSGAMPCAFDYINIPGALSFIKVPFLALVAFTIISIMLGNDALAGENAPDGGRIAQIAAMVIVIGTILAFVGLSFML
jgi:disulfide bond formation protein DsbB